MEFTSKTFTNKAEAKIFAKENHGYIEGPFMDENCSINYEVFYWKED